MLIRRIILFWMLVCASQPIEVSAQALQITASLVSAMKEADDAIDTLSTLHTAATDALAGKSVSAGTKWSRLSDSFKKAAADVQSVPLPSELVLSEPGSATDLANCSTRQPAVGKLNSYLAGLRAAQVTGQQEARARDRELAKVDEAQKALTYLIVRYCIPSGRSGPAMTARFYTALRP